MVGRNSAYRPVALVGRRYLYRPTHVWGTHAVFQMLQGSTASPACLSAAQRENHHKMTSAAFYCHFCTPLPAALNMSTWRKNRFCAAMPMAAAGRARAAIIGHACHDHFHPELKSDVNLWQYICAGSRASSLAAHPTHALSRRLFACPRASAPAAPNSKVAAG